MIRVVAAFLAAVALTGCGSRTDARRNAVGDYIAAVNDVQRDALRPWKQARNAYAGLGRGTVSDRQLRDLAAAPLTIRTLRQRIAAMTPPDDAKRLHTSLLRLLDLDASFADEVQTFARYVRDVGPLEQQLGATTARLQRELKQAHTAVPEQRALTAYASRLGGLLTRFRRLAPPPALAPWHAEQVARVARLRAAARKVSVALPLQDTARVQEGLAALAGAAAGSDVTTADRRAILAYNARLKRIRAAAAEVARAQSRLVQELT